MSSETSSYTVGVSHLLLALLHVDKVGDDVLREVLKASELELERLEFLGLGEVLVVLGLDAVLDVDVDLFGEWCARLAALGHLGLEADLEDVVLVGGEGELAAHRFVLVVEYVVLGVDHFHLGVVAGDFGELEVALDQNVLVYLLLEAFARVGRQVEHESRGGLEQKRAHADQLQATLR